MVPVSKEEYAKAVLECIRVARQPTGGGRVAAQALLSAYNGEAFQLDVSSMGNLDHKNYEIVLTVIRGRRDTWCEPHEMVKDGDRIFQELWQQWNRLELGERAKIDCPNCDGRGVFYIYPMDEEDMRTKPCTRCSGTGRICRCGPG